MDGTVRHMASSTDKVDQRLINLYIYQKAHLEGLKFGPKRTVQNPRTKKKYILPSKFYK